MSICTYIKYSTLLYIHKNNASCTHLYINDYYLLICVYCWYPRPPGTLDGNAVVMELDGCLSGPAGIVAHTDMYVHKKLQN